MNQSGVNVVLGLQRGDEGKGRIVDYLAKDHEVVARFNGGANAGHTISRGGQTFKLHQVPSGILYPSTLNLIGNGSLVDPVRLGQEIEELRQQGLEVNHKNLAVSYCSHLILPHHIMLDEIREQGGGQQGSTKRGIAYSAGDKYLREGVRAEILDQQDELGKLALNGLKTVNELRLARGLDEIEDIEQITEDWLESAVPNREFLADTVDLLHQRLRRGESALAEGAQAFALDIDHGMYPYVTSSHTTTGGALTGLGVGPKDINSVLGVVKAVKSHVGGGPFVTEISDPTLAKKIRGEPNEIDSEFGASTGRARRVGYLDLPELRHAIRVNGVNELALTKLDHLKRFGSSILVATSYYQNGDIIDQSPSSASKLEKCLPVYEELGLWNGEAVKNITSFNSLPREARGFVDFLEDELATPITFIGTGPGREDIIIRRNS